ncbi:MBL fold metallo-hydrolase [Robertkochia aurantiaca]|uniref:MBL fold metallo-hydrolase n=1 Tax=Robertkochia aurantiaca TaxID=2873700 RepID=UPI001CCA5B95|nr:MBL fold metallo-hydrolase [Robertkochia sp. 3YJGBD-33]
MLRKLKMVLFISTGLIVILFLGGFVFTKTAPQFGSPPDDSEKDVLRRSANYHDGKFHNREKTEKGDLGDVLKAIYTAATTSGMSPSDPLPTYFDEPFGLRSEKGCHITWFGHSAFLIEMSERRILIDPMFGDVAAPVSFGSARFPYQSPIPTGKVNNIDVVLLSHDHYDHLDYQTILTIDQEVKQYIVPLGVGSHLRAWGIDPGKIEELDWNDHTEFGGIDFTACTSRHFSGRAMTDQDETLWASWVINGNKNRIYFSGDGGYGTHFKEIGDKYGPFDLAMIECGQYNEDWKDIHMMPEQSVQAALDLRSRRTMPIHWGAFRLSVHPWKDPIQRFTEAADDKGVTYIHPLIGERFSISRDFPGTRWWEF